MFSHGLLLYVGCCLFESHEQQVLNKYATYFSMELKTTRLTDSTYHTLYHHGKFATVINLYYRLILAAHSYMCIVHHLLIFPIHYLKYFLKIYGDHGMRITLNEYEEDSSTGKWKNNNLITSYYNKKALPFYQINICVSNTYIKFAEDTRNSKEELNDLLIKMSSTLSHQKQRCWLLAVNIKMTQL